ncbi:MAG: MJ0042-type zinc finger domain-containing protein [Pseudomonadota bacterium]
MILTCGKCSTRYMADAASFEPDGRTVRCAACGHSWFQEPPRDAPARLEKKAEPSPEITALDDVRAKTQARIRARMTPAKAAGWALFLCIAGGLVGGLYMYREDVVALWPKAASAYALVGEQINTRGLAIEVTSHRIGVENGRSILEVEGVVANISDAALAVPLLRGALSIAGEEAAHIWTFAAADENLAPGERTAFRGRAPAPEASANLEVRFVRPDDLAE